MTLNAALPDPGPSEGRPPEDEADLRFWLENMARHHRYTPEEMAAATGLSPAQIAEQMQRFQITPENRPPRAPNSPLLVLPYPGGRHPRIGFLEGAIHPQRETKVSVFAPWNEGGYAVADVPEAIWSNLGLTYLAHTHVPTLWTQQGITLPPQEWTRHPDGALTATRTLPNGIAFGTKALPGRDGVRMELWLRNGTRELLSDLRVQNCVMLKGLADFTEQTNANKRFVSPFALCQSADGLRWILTAWDHCDRLWANAPCPCLHSDPKFPDCAPGETKTLRGWLSFYEGTDIAGEMQRITNLGWLQI
ncbi:MAG TPA: hypothetical protein VFB21_22095 [Chthonomonadaceae bacterium]|nr:hypothetical protein [Chthonomonadaceae bacterium]